MRKIIRWALLAAGLIALVIIAFPAGGPDRAPRLQRTIALELDPDSVEPAPLTFNTAIAPADAEAINAERPDFKGPIVAARPFVVPRSIERQGDLLRAAHCLTQAVYYEAASETPAGQRAVAQVVLNRVRDPRYPASVCGVIFQGSERTTGCQFTFTCDGAMARKPDPALFARARGVALAALFGQVEPLVGLATHYHTKQVVPFWRTELVKLRTVGAHIFYGWQGRERSGRGLRTAYAGVEPELSATPPLQRVPDIFPVIDVTEADNPFVAPPPTSSLPSPRISVPEFGQMQADDRAGRIAVEPDGGLIADNAAGTLRAP